MLDEYALRFYTLIEFSIKQDANEWQKLATATSLPSMEEQARKDTINSYERADYDIIEEIREAKIAPSSDALKEHFNG